MQKNLTLMCASQIAGENVRRVDRVLDVRQGELCWVAGTVYMELPMKPNILEDLTKEVSMLSDKTSATPTDMPEEFHVCASSPPYLHRPFQPRGNPDNDGR